MPIAAIVIFVAALLLVGITGSTRQGRVLLATAAADVAGWTIQIAVAIAPTVAVTFARGLVTAFDKDRNTWAEAVAVFVTEITGHEITAADFGDTSGLPLTGVAQRLATPLVQQITSAIAPPPPITPESGQRSVETLLGLNLVFGLQGWWTAAVGDLVSLGRFGAALDLPEAIERSLGLNRLGRLIWRTPVQKAIQEPLTELYNRAYRFKKLTIGEAHNAFHRGLITDAEYLDYAAAAGYDDRRAAQLLALAQASYPVPAIEEMSRLLGLPDDFLVQLLREQGFDSGRATTLLELARARSLQKVLDELVTHARTLYRAGRLTQAQLQDVLASAHHPEVEVNVILATEDLMRAEARTLTEAQLLDAFKAHVLDPADVRDRLRAMGYDNADIDTLFALHRASASTGQILDAVAHGQLSPHAAQARLEATGYTPDDAALLVSLKGRRLSLGQILDALRTAQINLETATADLVALGYTQDDVTVLLAFTRRVLAPPEIQAAVLRGLLTPEDAIAKLQALGYSLPDAAIIVDLRRRLLTVGQILDAYGDGFLTRAEALGDLQARGFAPDDALTLVRVFEAKQPPPATPGAAPAPVPRRPATRRHAPSAGTAGTGPGP